MKYTLTSQCEESVTIDGLGVLPPATPDPEGILDEPIPSEVTYDEYAVAAFYNQRGLHVNQVHLPEGVVATLVMDEVN